MENPKDNEKKNKEEKKTIKSRREERLAIALKNNIKLRKQKKLY